MADLGLPDWLLALMGQGQNNPQAVGPTPGLLAGNPTSPLLMGRSASVDTPAVASEDDTPATPTPTRPMNLAQAASQPNANVLGTPASAGPEASQPDFLSKLSSTIGGLYGQGGPGDALISLGAGLASPEGWSKGLQSSLKDMSANQLNNARLQAFRLQVAQQAQAQNATRNWLQSVKDEKGNPIAQPLIDLALAQSLNGDPAALHSLFKQYGEPDKYSPVATPGGPVLVNKYNPSDVKPIPIGGIAPGEGQPAPQKLYKSVTSQEDRAALGVPASDTRPIQQNTATGQWAFQTNEPAENTESQTLGKGRGDVATNAMKAGQAASQRIQDLDIINDAMKAGGNKISTGPFAKEALSVKQAVKNLTGYDLGATPETEVASKTGFALASAASRAINQRGGTQAEFLKALQNVPGIFLSPEGNQAMISILKQQAQHEQELGKLAYDHRPGDNWIQKETEFYNAHPIISPFTGKPMGREDAELLTRKADPTGTSMGGDIGPQAVPTQSGKIPVWNRQKGAFE